MRVRRAALTFPRPTAGQIVDSGSEPALVDSAEVAAPTVSDPPQFAICSRDGLAIMLRRVEAPEAIRPSESQGGTWDAFFWVDDADALHAELARHGATVVYGPLHQPAYDMREFAVRDCDGHVLGFGQVL